MSKESQIHPDHCAALVKAIELTRKLLLPSPDEPYRNRVEDLGDVLMEGLTERLEERLVVHKLAPDLHASNWPIWKVHSRGLFLGVRCGPSDILKRAVEIARREKDKNIYIHHGNERCLMITPPYDISEEEIESLASEAADALSKAASENLGPTKELTW